MYRIIVFGLIVALAAVDVCLLWKPRPKSQPFVVSAWIPYWKKIDGSAAVERNLAYFNELSPFAFEVKKDGTLLDTLKINDGPWPRLQQLSNAKKISVIPTILWTDPKAMHQVFSDPVLRKRHISQIVNMLENKKFSGIDIDYEGKDMADKDVFSRFIVELAVALKYKEYLLSCTVEARTSDFPPSGWHGVRAMAWANDYNVLNAYCDNVRIMAYDQAIVTKGVKTEWHGDLKQLYAPLADIKWVEDIIKYSQRSIHKNKIVLGIPTYGWRYLVNGSLSKWSFKCQDSVSYPQAIKLGQDHSITPRRDATTELHFDYQEKGKTYMVWFSDGFSVGQHIRLAKKYQLGGVSFFKMDGLEDNKMWQMIQEELREDGI